jgi:hypothetical protein
MPRIKDNILKNICYTKLVYDRINKKLNLCLSKSQIERYISKILLETDEGYFSKIGKNYYILNSQEKVRITINSYTYRVITVDRIS